MQVQFGDVPMTNPPHVSIRVNTLFKKRRRLATLMAVYQFQDSTDPIRKVPTPKTTTPQDAHKGSKTQRKSAMFDNTNSTSSRSSSNKTHCRPSLPRLDYPNSQLSRQLAKTLRRVLGNSRMLTVSPRQARTPVNSLINLTVHERRRAEAKLAKGPVSPVRSRSGTKQYQHLKMYYQQRYCR